MNKTILAIDPGKNGGVAYKIRLGEVCSVGCESMPKTEMDIADLIATRKNLQNKYGYTEDVVVYLEHQHSRPAYIKNKDGSVGSIKQGSKSSWTFSEGYGILKGCILTNKYRLIYVTPSVWQKHFNLLKKPGETDTDHKNRIKQFSQLRYPSQKITLANADAMAILEYAIEKEK